MKTAFFIIHIFDTYDAYHLYLLFSILYFLSSIL
jgi:hypothetical protein